MMAARKTPGGGRKPEPAGKRDRRISINVTPGDHDRITVAAGGRPVAAWCAEVVGIVAHDYERGQEERSKGEQP